MSVLDRSQPARALDGQAARLLAYGVAGLGLAGVVAGAALLQRRRHPVSYDPNRQTRLAQAGQQAGATLLRRP